MEVRLWQSQVSRKFPKHVTKYEAEQAEIKIKRDVFEGKYGKQFGQTGFNGYDVAKLMGHANISTSQPYVRNMPEGAGEAVMLKINAVTIPSQVVIPAL